MRHGIQRQAELRIRQASDIDAKDQQRDKLFNQRATAHAARMRKEAEITRLNAILDDIAGKDGDL